MTGTRIRWQKEDDGMTAGRIGTLGEPLFWISPPEGPGKAHILTSSLPGWDKDIYPNGFVGDVKATAERWLAEFVASLGAVFKPEPFDFGEFHEAVFRAQYERGRRVRYAHPDNGYPANREMAARFLTLGEVYVIERADIGSASTRLLLAGVDTHGHGFNSVLFEPVEEG